MGKARAGVSHAVALTQKYKPSCSFVKLDVPCGSIYVGPIPGSDWAQMKLQHVTETLSLMLLIPFKLVHKGVIDYSH